MLRVTEEKERNFEIYGKESVGSSDDIVDSYGLSEYGE